MLNNAFPQHVWHLYDSYLNPAGSYFGAKKALEAVHAQYDYADGSVWVVNSRYRPVRGLTVRAEAYTLSGRVVWSRDAAVGSLEADGTRLVFAVPGWVVAGPGTTLLRLTLQGGAAGAQPHDEPHDSPNVYWLTAQMDAFDWGHCARVPHFEGCAVSRYADFTDLSALPAPNLTATLSKLTLSTAPPGGEWGGAAVTLANRGSTVAFFVRLRLLTPAGADVLPVQWSDNYVTVLPAEAVVLSARFRVTDGPAARVVVEPFADATLAGM